MIKSIISLILLIASVWLAVKHGFDTFNYKNNPASLNTMNELGIPEAVIPMFAVLSIIIGILLLVPRTFFLGNLLNAIIILLIMALSLRAGNYKMALLEIPFLTMPLVMIWLKYPFKH